jgi:trimeric autotransporter adhesin
MTVSSSTSRASYSGNGSLTTFAYGFKVFDQDDLTVILRASNGTETVQTITTDYTVTGVGDVGGGNVVFGTAPASGVTVVILREMDLEQGLDLVPNDPFPAQSLEDSLDKLTFMVQQHNEELGRAIKASRTNVLAGSEFVISAADRANKVFSFDGSGDLAVTQELGTFQGNWATATVYKVRDLVKDTSTNNIFLVNAAHTSSGAQPLTTNANSAKYDLIVDAAAAATSAAAAASSATDAETAQTASEAAQAAAEAAQASAETAETNAETAETNAETAQAAAEAAQAAAELVYDNFDDRYLGAKSTSGGDPTLDNDGDALIDGALFFDTTNNVMKVYNLGTTTWLRTTPTTSDQTNINTVSGIQENVTTVAGIDSDVTTVAGISSNVTTVAGISSDVTAVAANATDIGTVAGQATQIGLLGTADAVSDMNTLAVAGIIADMDSLADNVSAISIVSDDIGYVIAVAINAANINTVAADGADIGTVATSIASVNTAATNIASINTNATNITDIQNASANAATATTQAGIATTQAGIATTQAGIATTKASEASASEANADTSEANALTYSSNAATSAAAAASSAAGIAGYDLDVIAETKGVTAVDVFVYDTSKDSDGGAWRKRTQGTSWYNEAASATRGSRKEFPAVAVIVAEIAKVTIYDGDDPSLPMWMVFNANGSSADRSFWASSFDVSSLAAKNGQLSIGINVVSVGSGVLQIGFVADILGRVGSTSVRGGTYSGILGRNSDPTLSGVVAPIVNSVVKDVAMTVLPNAPIDAATGLPVPTIAVATGGGTSVIRDDGAVVDITTNNASYTSTHSVKFKDGGVYNQFGQAGNGAYSYYYIFNTIPAADTQITLNTLTATGQNPDAFGTANVGAGNTFDLIGGGATVLREIEPVASGGDKGLTMLSGNLGVKSQNEVAFVTSTYNTGWMNGDIKLATLADTDDTDLVGSGELVTNGTFESDTSGWTASNATLSVVSSTLKVADNGSNSTGYQAITTVVGKTYTISLDIVEVSGNTARVYVYGTQPTSGYLGTQLISTSTLGSYGLTFVANATTTYLQLCSEGTSYVRYDNVSVRLAEADRSVNGNGLQVFGTVTKNPVATGADLVAYSGWSTSNYLEQPYNADLQFGTGDFVIMSWIKKTSGSTQGVIVDTRSAASSNAGLSVEVLSNQTLRLRTRNSSSEALTVTTGVVPTNTWTHFACVVSASGTNHKIYLNGKLDVSASVAAYSVDSSSPLWIGGAIGYSDVPLSDGSLALLRISATAPSPEQIKKIYEDEKFLFQENAQATLYGSSDAVTALAYDDTTELLHVGTSAGRSVFQGLRRVENTTTAVGTAISASNSLVVEE